MVCNVPVQRLLEEGEQFRKDIFYERQAVICKALHSFHGVRGITNLEHDLQSLQDMSYFVEGPSVIMVGAH